LPRSSMLRRCGYVDPEGVEFSSPGQRPGYSLLRHTRKALKGRDMDSSAPSGLPSMLTSRTQGVALGW